VAHELSQLGDSEDDYMSSSEIDCNSYLKTALAVLISVVEQGATSPVTLKTLVASSKNNPQDNQLAGLLAHVANLLFDYRSETQEPLP
jgi:hypothetical protein